MGRRIGVLLAGALLPGVWHLPGEGKTASKVTVFFEYRGEISGAAQEEMKRELDRLLNLPERRFEWKRVEEASELGPVENLAVVRFRGDCRMPAAWPPLDERGPLAWTYVTDGAAHSFGEIDCDRLRGAVAAALWGDGRRRADFLLGRALGRVVAHELMHIVGGKRHGKSGLGRPALTGPELIVENATFHPDDLHRLDRGN